MRTGSTLWVWRGAWAATILAGLGFLALYAKLPADGAGGGLESFASEGFRIEWLLEEREGGLQVEDIIVRGGGHTADEWLRGAPRGPGWRTGGTVTYEIVRDGQAMTLSIRLASIPLQALLARWWAQLAVSLALLVAGSFVFWKRPYEPAARVLMLFCVTVAVQLWCDAYNFQFSTLPWQKVFWFHLFLEHLTFTVNYASICHFALIFPGPHPLVQRFPRGLPFVLYISNPLAITLVMTLSPTPSEALVAGNQASFVVMLLQLGLATVAGIRAFITARDPVSRAQMRWILWGAGIAFAVVIPGYVLPLMLIGRPLLPHSMAMLFTVIILYVYAIAIFRYRLFDIEIIINRTLVYGTLTLLLGSLYVILVRLLTLLFQTMLGREDDTLIVFTAALGIALAFDPLRRRVQALIDRTFYRAKLDYHRMLTEMAEKVATSIVLDQLAILLTQELPQRLQIAWATLAVLDSPGKHFVPTNSSNQQSILPMDHPLVTHLQRLGQPLLRLQPPSHLPAEAQRFLEQQHIELSIPLIASTEQVGLYNLGPKLSGGVYNREEIRLLHLMGQQAAIAVENSRLFLAEREQHKLSEALQEAADAVSSTLDLDQVLDRILEQVEQVVQGDAFNVMLIKGEQVNVVRCRGYERLGVEKYISNFSVPVAEYSTLSKMIQTGQPIIIQDTATDPNWIWLEGWEGIRSYVSAPIQVAGQIAGFLNVDGKRPDQFGPADAQRLEAFAYHAAIAMQNARLYEQAQQEIAERKQAEEQIKTSLKEKEVLLKEIHHRVKNNLQVISSLLYLQSKQIDDRKILGMFQESQHRVRSMALVHERLYQTEDLSSVDFGEYIRQLTSYLFRSYGATSNLIRLNVNVSHVSLDIDTAIPCGLIVNELVSNSLKHAFPRGQPGEILIELDVNQEGQHMLMIGDNGIGLPDKLDFRNTRSLGLQLVNTLVNQLEGDIKVERENGTRFEITFTDPSYRNEEQG